MSFWFNKIVKESFVFEVIHCNISWELLEACVWLPGKLNNSICMIRETENLQGKAQLKQHHSHCHGFPCWQVLHFSQNGESKTKAEKYQKKRERCVLLLNWYNVTEYLLYEVNCGPLSDWELLLNSFYDYSSSFIIFFPCRLARKRCWKWCMRGIDLSVSSMSILLSKKKVVCIVGPPNARIRVCL